MKERQKRPPRGVKHQAAPIQMLRSLLPVAEVVPIQILLRARRPGHRLIGAPPRSLTALYPVAAPLPLPLPLPLLLPLPLPLLLLLSQPQPHRGGDVLQLY